MSLEKCHQALIAKLLAGMPTWAQRIAWPNVAFNPKETGLNGWLQWDFMGADERVQTLGVGGYDEANGLVQITVAYPAGGGEQLSRKTINELRACFTPGNIGHDGQSVTILSRSAGGGGMRDGFYKIPFTIRWRAQLPRT